MAVTKIIAVKGRLAQCLDYTSNPQKTALGDTLAYAENPDKTGRLLYTCGFNCDVATAYPTMLTTKARWGKTADRHVAGYHLIQSFAPGEVTPQQCFDIGCEFARRYLADRYECTVSAHLDREHLHCHIVFNSVSFVDGKMFRNDFSSYYRGIRKVSDELCRENRLSVIQTDGKGQPYQQWSDRAGIRTLIQADMDAAIQKTGSWTAFLQELARQGYQVNPSGPRRKYTTLRPPGGQRNIRLASLAPGYREEDVKAFFAGRRQTTRTEKPAQQRAAHQPPHRRYAGKFPPRYRRPITGLAVLYYRYCALLRRVKTGRCSKRYRYLLGDELKKFDRYCKQAAFLWRENIQTDTELDAAAGATEQTLSTLLTRRKALYRQKDALPQNAVALQRQIETLSADIKAQRSTLRLCEAIRQDAARLQGQLQEARNLQNQERREIEQHEQRWRSR